MNAHRKPSLLTPIIALVLILLVAFGGYMGSYYAMLKDREDPWLSQYTHKTECLPVYRSGNSGHAMRTFFTPAHQIDLWLRPEYWSVDAFLKSQFDEAPLHDGIE